MKIEYHKWYSERLNRDMELKVYGHNGKPFIIFPCQNGRFYESEDFGMIGALSELISDGRIKVFAIDGIDNEAWANYDIHPYDRGVRYSQYEGYLMHEFVPFVRNHCHTSDIKIATAGFSMGGYHAANFFFKHPDVFDVTISLSAIYDLRMYVGDYVDTNVYYNSPLLYLANLQDENILNLIRSGKIVISCGQGNWEEEMLADIAEIRVTLERKQIPAWIDLWGNDVDHDWPWWRKMMPYFIDKLGF